MPENGVDRERRTQRDVAPVPEARIGLLSDQVCIVTGAGQGLGRAICAGDGEGRCLRRLLERNAETL